MTSDYAAAIAVSGDYAPAANFNADPISVVGMSSMRALEDAVNSVYAAAIAVRGSYAFATFFNADSMSVVGMSVHDAGMRRRYSS